MTSDINTVCRMPLALDILVTGTGPARLPADRHPGPRALRLVAGSPGEYLFVGIRGGTGALEETRTVRLDPGDICFYDVDRPPSLDVPAAARLKVFRVPRETLGLDDRALRRILPAPVGRSSRLGRLVSPFLSELADTVLSAPAATGEMLAWNAVNLLATVAAEQSGEDGPDAPGDERSPLLSRLLRFVDEHLADPDLSPEMIAGAHHISVRYLHKLFQQEQGTTVGRWIQRRRLEECRRDLLHRVRGRRTIAAVAGRWGFLSAPHFSRVFRAAYGMSPSQWRDSAGVGSGSQGGRALSYDGRALS